MAYERDDDRYRHGPQGGRHDPRHDAYDRGGSQFGSGRDRDDRDRGPDGGRGPGPRGDRSGYRGQPQGYDYEDRGFFERTADEVRSWFGDEEAERRRRYDERYGNTDAAEHDRNEGGRGHSRPPYGDRAAQGDGGRFASGGAGGSGFGGRGRSDFGAGRGAGATMAYGLGAGQDREQWGHDPSYRSWRDRQVESLDRDYDEYRREHQSKFESEFSNWRTGRQTQRESLNRVQEHQEVVGSDGAHVGTVDKVRGDQIILTKSDPDAGGHHHAIPSSWIDNVDTRVTLRKTADEAKAHWRDIEQSSAFGARNRDDDRATRSDATGDADGPHTTNRGFPGAY